MLFLRTPDFSSKNRCGASAEFEQTSTNAPYPALKLCRCRLAGTAKRWFPPGPAMHLRFTEEELSTLVEMVSLAAEVASWNERPGSEEGLSCYEALEDKVLEKAKLAGLGEKIKFDEEKQRHHLDPDHQEGTFFQQCYDEFRNEVFWEELVIRLSDRDLARVIGMNAWQEMTEEDRRHHTRDIEKRYWEEFSKNGIERLAVIFPPSEG